MSELAPGCRSAASPCNHQKASPETLCETCRGVPARKPATANTAKQLAGLIMDADLPKRLLAENAKLKAVLLECKYGAEYPDELGDKIAAALGAVNAH